MSVQIMSLVYSSRLGCPIRKAIALKLADCANDDGEKVYPGVPRVATECEIDERTVQRKIRQFEAAGLLVRVKDGGGAGRTTIYRFDMRKLRGLSARVLMVQETEGGFEIVPVPEEGEKGDSLPPFSGVEKGDSLSPFEDENPGSESKNPGTQSKNPGPRPPEPSEPSEPSPSERASAQREGEGWSRNWDRATRDAVDHLRTSATVAHVATAFVDRVRGTLNPPASADGPAFVRQLGARLGRFSADVLEAAADEMLAVRKRDLPAVPDIEAVCTECAGDRAEKRISISIAADPEACDAWRSYAAARRASDPTLRAIWTLLTNHGTALVPSRLPPADGATP